MHLAAFASINMNAGHFLGSACVAFIYFSAFVFITFEVRYCRLPPTHYQDHDMFAVEEPERVKHLAEMEKMCDLYDLDQLRGLNDRLVATASGEAARAVFLAELDSLNTRLGQERAKVAEMSRGGASAENKTAGHAKVQFFLLVSQ